MTGPVGGFDAYGNPSNPTIGTPFQYQGAWGGYTDSETGLVLQGHRFYDPATGTWLTRDPIGQAGGINVYGYVGGDPVNWSDPWGTRQVDISVGTAAQLLVPFGGYNRGVSVNTRGRSFWDWQWAAYDEGKYGLGAGLFGSFGWTVSTNPSPSGGLRVGRCSYNFVGGTGPGLTGETDTTSDYYLLGPGIRGGLGYYTGTALRDYQSVTTLRDAGHGIRDWFRQGWKNIKQNWGDLVNGRDSW